MATIGGLLHHMMPVLLQEWGTEGRGWHASHLIDFREGVELVVDVPMEGGYDVPLRPGDGVRVQTSHADGIRRFASTVQQRREIPSPCLYLSWPGEVERIQRRQHVRIETAIPVRLQLPAAAEEEMRWVTGQTADVSAGGLKIRLGEPVATGLIGRIEIDVPGHGIVSCEARTLRAGHTEMPEGTIVHWLAMQFTTIAEPDRRGLAQFVAGVQRDRIRRGSRRH